MSNNKPTAVEWLIEQIEGDDSKIARVIGLKKYNYLIQQAKEMEKQQIIKAFDKGADIGNDIGSNYDYHEGNNQGYQYYNQEYGI